MISALQQICAEQNLNLSLVSDGYVAVVDNPRSNKKALLYGNDLGLNPSSSARIASDKVATYDVLKLSSIPAVEHVLALRPNLAKSWQNIHSMKEVVSGLELKLGSSSNFVVKIRSGSSGGYGVFLAKDRRQLKKKLRQIWKKDRATAVSKLLKIENEFRVVVLDGVAELVYAKDLAPNWSSKSNNSDELVLRNLAHGAIARVLKKDDIQLSSLQDLALRAMAALSLRFASVDIVEVDGELLILEVNQGVMLEYFSQQSLHKKKLAEDLYRKAILAKLKI